MFRLLIVDDEPAIAEGLAEMLLTYDLPLKEIKFTYSAKDALDLFGESPFDMVLADIRMPEMSGLEFFEKVIEQWKTCKVVFLTGFSDFEYARKAIKLGAVDYLLKPADDDDVVASLNKAISILEGEYERMMALSSIQQKVKEAIPAMQQDFLRYLLENTAVIDQITLQKKFNDYQIPFSPEQLVTTIVMKIDEWELRFNPEDEHLVQFAVQNMFSEMLETSGQLVSFRPEEKLIAILVQPTGSNHLDRMSQHLKDRLADAQETIYRVLGVTVSFAMSPTFVSWLLWPESFRYLVTSIKYCLNKGSLLVSDLKNEMIDYTFINSSISKINAVINSRDLQQFEIELNQLFNERNHTNPLSQESLSLIYIGICNYMLNLMLMYNFTQSLDAATTEKLTNFRAHKDIEAIKKFLLNIYKNITDKINIKKHSPTDTLVEQVKFYIDSHLDEELSLNILAKIKFVSSSYLSRIFHQITGEQMMGYITKKKMERAKGLLSNSDFRIQDVSEKLGYQSPNYFSKVFRQTYGISPQDYRSSKN